MGVTRIGSPYDPYGSKEVTKGSRVAGLGTRSLFLSFVLPFVIYSVLLPLLAHQLPRLGWKVSPSATIQFFVAFSSFVLSFLSLFLALLRADPTAVG